MSIGNSLDPEMLGSLIFPSPLSVIIVFGILAFFGYRLFRYFLVISGAVGCGFIGYTVISPLMFGVLNLASPSQFLLSILFSIVMALAGGLLVNHFMRASVYLFMAGIGFYLFHELALLLAERLSPLAFLGEAAPAAIFATLLGLAFGSITLPFFKAIYIFLTSVGGLTLAGYLIADTFLTSTTLLYVLSLLGAIGGVYAMRYQFRTNLKSRTPGDTDEDVDEAADAPAEALETPAPKSKRESKKAKHAHAGRAKATRPHARHRHKSRKKTKKSEKPRAYRKKESKKTPAEQAPVAPKKERQQKASKARVKAEKKSKPVTKAKKRKAKKSTDETPIS